MTISIKDNPYFAAYTRLTIGAHGKNFKQRTLGENDNSQLSINFNDFMDALKENEPINQDYARILPKSQIRQSSVNIHYNNNPDFESKTLDIIKKAYALGLVNYSDMLIPSIDFKI